MVMIFRSNTNSLKRILLVQHPKMLASFSFAGWAHHHISPKFWWGSYCVYWWFFTRPCLLRWAGRIRGHFYLTKRNMLFLGLGKQNLASRTKYAQPVPLLNHSKISPRFAHHWGYICQYEPSAVGPGTISLKRAEGSENDDRWLKRMIPFFVVHFRTYGHFHPHKF